MDDDCCVPLGLLQEHTKIGPVHQVKVTYHTEQYGIQIQEKSMTNEGSLSWIVIARGINIYVEEVYFLPWSTS